MDTTKQTGWSGGWATEGTDVTNELQLRLDKHPLQEACQAPEGGVEHGIRTSLPVMMKSHKWNHTSSFNPPCDPWE